LNGVVGCLCITQQIFEKKRVIWIRLIRSGFR